MIFIDTNYFLRFLLKDNNQQSSQAKELFLQAARGKKQLVTSLLVFFEVCWVLRSVYGKDKASLAKILSDILSLNFVLDERRLILESLDFFKNTNLSLEDCYNLIFAKQKKATEFKTFDLKLAKIFQDKPN